MSGSTVPKSLQPASSLEQFLHPQSGFIRHPESTPVELRSLPAWRQWRQRHAQCRGPAILCSSPHYLPPGLWAEMSIPMRSTTAIFVARVVLVRALTEGYEIGLRLPDTEEGARLRIVEQFCHMQHYCDNDTTAVPDDNREQRARNWVRQNASRFPSL